MVKVRLIDVWLFTLALMMLTMTIYIVAELLTPWWPRWSPWPTGQSWYQSPGSGSGGVGGNGGK